MINNSSLLKPQEIENALQHPDPEIRIQAIKDLISLHEPKYIDQLLDLSKSESDVQIKFEIRKGIGLLRKLQLSPSKVDPSKNKNIEKVESALQSGQEEQIHKAFRYITQYRLKQFLPQMMTVANDSNSSYLKGMVLKFMLSLGGEIYFEDITSYLNDSDPRVISTAIETIESIGNTKALSLIAQLVTHEHNRVQATAMKALYNLGDSSALNLFKKMIRSKHTAYRNSAVYALKEMKIKSSIPLLIELMEDESQSVKEKAIAGLQALAAEGSDEAHQALNLDSPKLIPEAQQKDTEATLLSWIKETLSLPPETARIRLLKCIKDENPSDKCLSFILSAFATIGTKEDIEQIKEYLSSDNDRVRANTVECLSALMDEEQLSELQAHLTDFNNRVIGNAIMALYEFEENICLESLDALIKSNSKNEQLTAVFVMGAIGEDNFLKNSEYLLESSFPEVREKMIKILEDLSQDSAIAHRFIKQNQLRMAAFIPVQVQQNKRQKLELETEKPIPKETIENPVIDKVDESYIVETQEEEIPEEQQEKQPDKPVSQVIEDNASNSPIKSIKPLLTFLKSLPEKFSNSQLNNRFSDGDFEVTSLLGLIASYCFYIVILISSILLPSHLFFSSISKNLRMIFLTDTIFTIVMVLIFPVTIGYFYIQNRSQLEEEELIIGPAIGFALFLFIPCTEILNLKVTSLNFLSHDSVDLMFYQMPQFKPFAYIFFSLPLLILPVAIESFLIHSAVRKTIAIVVSSVCISSLLWMGTLNQHSAVLLQEIQAENLYAYYFTQHKKAKALQNDVRLRLISTQARNKKKPSKELGVKLNELNEMYDRYRSKQNGLWIKLQDLKEKM